MIAILLMIGARPAQADRDAAWEGVYRLHRMLTFYVVNDGAANFDVHIRWQSQWQSVSDTPILVRALNPDEQAITRHLDPGLKQPGGPAWHEFTVPVTASGAGVYQIIVTGFGGGYVDFSISPTLPWGVYGYPTLGGTDCLTEAYFYLPPNMTSLSVNASGTFNYLRLTDANDLTHLNITGANPSGACPLPAGVDQVWRLTAQAAGECEVTFGVAPIILCPDAETALAIRSSIDVLPDGTICYHKFQIQAHDLLATYAALNPSAYAVSPPNLGAQYSQWMADPSQNSLLLGWYGVFGALPSVLAEQNLDPASPWFGSIRAWHDASGNAKPNPWITYERGGLVDPAPGINVLAAVHSVNDPINPLHHNANLRNRIIVAALRQMMMLREHELPGSTHVNYDGGEKAFDFAYFTRAFPWTIAQCPGDVQQVWREGLRRYVDHMVLTSVPQIANQWSFIMLGLQNFAKGTGEQQYRDYVQMHIDWLLTQQQLGYGAAPAGYFSDGEGPDASYAGINMHNFAWLCENADNQPLKQAVIDSFRLFNHTVAPEPDGTWLGACSFNHRMPNDWAHTQWTVGAGILADDSAEAAVMLGHCWLPWKPAQGPGQLASQQATLQQMLQYYDDAYDHPDVGPCILDGPMIPMAIYEHYMGTPLTGQLPMKASDHFTRKFGDEFFAVRRPSYYALLYSGKTFDTYREASAPTQPDVQYPRNGGGLSMLWSSKFGSSILSKNWSAYSTNGIIARNGPQTWFEDYWSVTSGMHANQSRATIKGTLTDGKMTFRRQLSFFGDRITGEIRLRSPQAVTYDKLWECFPYPLDKPDAIHVTLHDAQGNQIAGNNKMASAIVFRNDANEVHIFAFDSPRRCEFGEHTSTDAYGMERTHGRVLTSLPSEWNANQARTVTWAARVVRPNQVKATIKQLVGSLQ